MTGRTGRCRARSAGIAQDARQPRVSAEWGGQATRASDTSDTGFPADSTGPASASRAAASSGPWLRRLPWVDLGRIAVVAIQLGLLLLVMRTFSIESAGLFKVFAICSAGFVVQALLPAGLRMPLFVLMSLAGITLLLGPRQGGALFAAGLALIGLAHLPVRFALRVVLILTAGAVLAACRGGLFPCPWMSAVWPVFGAMFMFRLIVYLYDLKNRAAPFGLWRSLSYFFVLPNISFTLFPVVDYKNFSRGYQARDRFVTYQTGVNWIFRGLIQFIAYRAVYQYLPSDAGSVNSSIGAALYFVRPYLLYLRISGSFHFVIGILHLFGFNLPRTNYNYLLASSFTDYWRRVNIYWKDFLQKIFFNPAYMRLKRSMGATAALVVATGIAFFVTWALHSYQWFWIRGAFPVIWQDMVFWGVMGFLVLANMLWEERRGRQRSLAKPRLTLKWAMGLALRTVGTFLVICASWAVWSAQSWGEMGLVASRLAHPGPTDVLWILAGLVGLGVVAVLYARVEKPGVPEVEAKPRVGLLGIPIPVSAFRVALVSGGLVFLVFGQLYWYYPPTLANPLNQMRNQSFLSSRDQQLLTRGYYEDLGDVARFNPQLADVFQGRPAEWNRCWAIHRTGGFPSHEILPSRRVIDKGAPMSTNRWAMRDREYEQARPAGTYRFAILGSSNTMGNGVADDETFENMVEDRLNREISPRTGVRYEILNFAVSGWGPVACYTELKKRVFDFQPDAVIFTGVNEFTWVIKELTEDALGYYQLPYPDLREIARPAGLQKEMGDPVIREKLWPYREQLLSWVYERDAGECTDRGVRPMIAFLPPHGKFDEKDREEAIGQVEVARRAGMTVIDLVDAFEALPSLEVVWLRTWDLHPNAEGHRMIAEGLYAGLVRELGLGGPAEAVTAAAAQSDSKGESKGAK